MVKGNLVQNIPNFEIFKVKIELVFGIKVSDFLHYLQSKTLKLERQLL